jgi:hypothetical protein
MASGGGYSVDCLFVYAIILFLFQIKLQNSSLMKMMKMMIYTALSPGNGKIPKRYHRAQGRARRPTFPEYRHSGRGRSPARNFRCSGTPETAGHLSRDSRGRRSPGRFRGTCAAGVDGGGKTGGPAIQWHAQANVASNSNVIRYAPAQASAGGGRERACRHGGICPSQTA